ncbi:hypothetical protein AU099_gp73 [Gordonia phage GTE8]|uniref:Uncharacterized protein n=1 Tax=Gordonia phage GTE8 TaxID=1647475 RepID=A0A0K0N6Z4_9CAUD|nr:hypothetical protein AU099_gp73 [Gordonia phage GTE8]AKJ72416.1 hypothetical protein GTE8_73 [Gordonia phage GTE8]
MPATGYLGHNVYRSADDHKQPTPVELLTGHRPRALRRNDEIGPAIAARTDPGYPAREGSSQDIRNAVAFRTRNGSVSAGWIPCRELCRWITGRYDGADNGCALPGSWVRELTEVASTQLSAYVYVVFSYETPIAWLDMRDTAPVPSPLLTVPDVRYSLATGRHQTSVLSHLPLKPNGERDYSRSYVTTGQRATLPDVDPGEVRRGRGASPFGPRSGGY